MHLIVPFPGTDKSPVEEVGGKGLSLIRMVEAGLPVPPGAVLTAAFFAPWFDQLEATSEWAALVNAPPSDWTRHCDALKALSHKLPLAEAQSQAIAELRRDLLPQDADALFAVRSSSPEEDLASASFAGGYETRLGVRRDGLEDAVRHAFASSLDARVLVYKQAHGFDVFAPRIAVVVQQQIASDVSGVGFSLNPTTNDFDEAVIDANWGLGESVVAGLVTPDHFVVDKVNRRIVEQQLGAKERSVWLGPDGGTFERECYRSEEFALGDDQLEELTDLLVRAEELLERPVDVEWAFAADGLHVLQARPITTYVPLPPEMVTPPGERRQLYMDAALSKGLAISTPISPMGLDWLADIYLTIIEQFTGAKSRDVAPAEALWFFAGGRMYLNASNMMYVTSIKSWAKSTSQTDALMADIVANIDSERYRAPKRPTWARLRMLRYAPRVLWRLRRFLWSIPRALLSPRRTHEEYQRAVDAYETKMTAGVDYDLPFDEFRHTYAVELLRTFDVSMSGLLAGVTALSVVDRLAGKPRVGEDDLAERLKRGFPGNAVVDMGVGLYDLARRLDPSDYDPLEQLAERVTNREMDPQFLAAWDAFLARFGSRGPREMDLASPGYADDPMLALRQMSYMADVAEENGPREAQERNIKARREAYELLMGRSGRLRRTLLRRAHMVIELFAGTRDTPKLHSVMYNYVIRTRALAEGRRLVEQGRLDAAEHVFDLRYSDLAAANDPALDLRAVRAERKRFLDLLSSQVKGMPHIIDSRGRILRPAPREETPGELRGMPASPGVVSGPVKLLHDPLEKPIERGDVLVAYTTDPGWTPLFVTAAAVVLQVGGILQHGAVVAREYGRPCVVGIDQLTNRLQDGQLVEVDGTEGVVRLQS